MHHRHSRLVRIGPPVLALLVSLGGRASGQTQETERPTLRVGTLPQDFNLDGVRDGEAWWTAADSIANLTTVEPQEGEVPAERTTVRVLANESEIVIGARCYDPEPDGIVSFSKARDSDLMAEDCLVVVLDTFLDSRSGYVFAVNPSGSRFDGLVAANGEDVNSEWDAVWEAKTSRDRSGWTAEIRIPIRSLGFKKDLTSWGFNVQRRVQRLQETSRWSGINIDYEIYQTSRAGLLTNLPRFDLGAGLSIRSSAVSRARTPGPHLDSQFGTDFSLDATKTLGPNLQSALTVNTDFAESEVDVRQLNLTRFPLFFPEKRTFFLDGSDIFEFGLGLDEETMLPFFSRRVGLYGPEEDDQVAVPINAGGKISGRVGDTNLGALVVNTRKVNTTALTPADFDVDVPRTTMGAVRVKQNVLEESSVGMLATFGDQQGRSRSWSGGLDLTYQTSNFQGDKNLLVGVWGLLNDRHDLTGDKSAVGALIDYPNDLLDISLLSVRIGDGFDPSLGFVPRNNVHIWDLGMEFNPRSSSTWLRRMFHEVKYTLYNELDNSRWQSYTVSVKPFDWLLESGDRFSAGIQPEGDRPPQAFEVTADVDVQPNTYEWIRYFAEAHTADKRRISGEVNWESGSYYEGELNTLEAKLALKPSALGAVEFSGERSTGHVMALIDDFEEHHSTAEVEKHFKEQLYGIRLQLNISPDLQLSSLTQYDTQSREMGTNNRLRWTFDPLGDLFVVYNHNMQRTLNRRWGFVSSELPVKLQYARRF